MAEYIMAWWLEEGVLHALGTASPITVVKVEALALKDEGAHAILGFSSAEVAMRAV